MHPKKVIVKIVLVIVIGFFTNTMIFTNTSTIFAADSSKIPAGAIQDSAVDGSAYSCISATGNDSYACNLNISPQPTAYVTNAHYTLKTDVANTGPASVNFSAIGVKPIKKWVAGVKTDLITGDLAANQVVELTYDGTDMVPAFLGVGSGGGSVTSVGLSLPAQFTISASPVTTSGILTGAWTNQTANFALLGPTSGAAAVPSFRAIGTTDLPGKLIDGSFNFAADGGSTDDYASCPQSLSGMATPGYIDGSIHSFRANTSNTGAATWNGCGLGAKAIVKVAGGVSSALATNDIRVGQNVIVQYRASTQEWQIQSTLGNAASGGAGTPGGSDTQCQFNNAGAFGGDPGCTFNSTTDILSLTGGVTVGTGNSTILASSGLTADRTVTNTVDVAGNLGVTTGTRTSGDALKFAADGSMVRAGTAQKLIQFMIGADDGSALVDTNDQTSIFYNHYGQGLTINSVWCETDTGTSNINIARDDGTPANILSASLTCSNTGATTTTFSGTENQIASTHRIDFVMVTAAVSGTPHRITVSIRYTLD